MEVVEVGEIVALPVPRLQVIEGMSEMRELLHSIRSLHNVDFQNLVDKDRPTYGYHFLDPVDSLLSDRPFNVRSCHKDVSSRSGVLTLESMAVALALRKWLMRPEPHEHLFCYPLEYGQWYKKQPRAEKEEDSEGDVDERSSTI